MDNSNSARIKILQAQLDVVNAQNARLGAENAQLRHKLNEQRSGAVLNVEAKINAFQMEDQRDRMYENLERLKKKYNKLHEAYLEMVKRCKALEETFKRQKTLSGLVMKSAIEQRQKEEKLMHLKRLSEEAENSTAANLEKEVSKLRVALDEAYDIIDELEFELESIDYLEMENQRMQNELAAFKTNKCRYAPFAANSTTQTTLENNADEVEEEDEAPPRYAESEHGGIAATAASSTRHLRRQSAVVSSASSARESYFNDDDADSATLERAALTNSLIQTAEAESNCLRRELLRSRLQQTLRPPPAVDEV